MKIMHFSVFNRFSNHRRICWYERNLFWVEKENEKSLIVHIGI